MQSARARGVFFSSEEEEAFSRLPMMTCVVWKNRLTGYSFLLLVFYAVRCATSRPAYLSPHEDFADPRCIHSFERNHPRSLLLS